MALQRLALFSLYFILVSSYEESACKIEKDVAYLKQLWDKFSEMEHEGKYSSLPGELSPLVICPKKRSMLYDLLPKGPASFKKRTFKKFDRGNCALYYIKIHNRCIKESDLLNLSRRSS